MARNLGNIAFGKNLEVQTRAPLDARNLVALKSDLTNTNTWVLGGSTLSYAYKGMPVIVIADPVEENNGLYILLSDNGYNVEENWKKLSNDTVFEITNINMSGDYDDTEDRVYMKGDLVRVGGSLYFCLIDNTTNIRPAETPGWETNWALFQLKGSEGDRGHTPVIGDNGNWYINEEDTHKQAIGKDGISPHIENGYWYIGQEQQSTKASGDTVSIDNNGFWRINGVTTNPQVQARGQNGQNAIARINYTGAYSPTKDYTYRDEKDYTDLAIGSDGHAYICMVSSSIGYNPVGDTTGRWSRFIMSGADGAPGLTPEIKNGLWWIGDENKNIKAEGSVITLVGGYWFINGNPTYQRAKGDDGASAIANINMRGNFDPLLTYNNIDEFGRADVVVGSDGNMYYSRVNDNTMNPVPFYDDALLNWALFSMHGKEGTPGSQGRNGSEPYIAPKDGILMWWVKTPYDDRGVVKYEHKCLDVVAQGMSPYIGENLNWWIGNSDSGFKAVGQDAVANVNYLGEWLPGEQYYHKNPNANEYTDVVVGSDGSAYWAKANSLGQNPVLDTERAYWLRFVMKGAPGANGRGVLLSKSDTHILWQQVGDEVWTNLIEISALRGEGAYSDVALNVGTIIQWAGKPNQIPEGWLLCDGQQVNRVTHSKYRQLVEALTGTSTTTTANVPDLRSRFIVGMDTRDPEYTYAGSIGPVVYGTVRNSSTGGLEALPQLSLKKIRLKESESGLPKHRHNVPQEKNTSGSGWYGIETTDQTDAESKLAFNVKTSESGGLAAAEAHENRPPYYVTAFIIKAAYTADMFGKTAYDVYLQTSPEPVLSKADWLESLRGDTGPTGINPRGDYASGTAYAIDDVIRINNEANPENGNAFVCKQASTGIEPGITDGWRDYWYPFVMRGAPGKDAFQLKIEYSVDGATAWHADATPSDAYCRFSTNNGIAYGAAVHFKGNKGDNAFPIQIQYSADNISYHDTATLLDKYCRFSTDNKVTWGSAIQIGAGGGGALTAPLTVNLSGNKVWGAIPNNTTIPAGTTYDALFRQALIEKIAPTASIAVTGSIPFNRQSATLNLTLSSNANNPGATITSFKLSFRRGTGEWIVLYNGEAKSAHEHVVNLSTDNTSTVSYSLSVTNSVGLSHTVYSSVITPASYSAPEATGSITATKEKGNVSHRLFGAISQLAQTDVSITSRALQYSTDNAAWTEIATFTTNNFDYTHNDASLKDADKIYYRLLVTCSIKKTQNGIETITNQATPISMGDVTFVYFRYSGAVSATPAGVNSTARRAAVITYSPTLQQIRTDEFLFITGAVQKSFFICLPPGMNLLSIYDESANASVSSVRSTYVMKDAGGNDRSHTMYAVNLGQAYSSSHNWRIKLGTI